MNFEVTEGKTTKCRLFAYVLTWLVLCAVTAQRAGAQSPTERDVSGTTWDCRVDISKIGAAGQPSDVPQEDHVLITFHPGGSSVSSTPLGDWPQSAKDVAQANWAFGKWKQEGATVRAVSNGTVESFHAQPWVAGDAEKMIELKISGDRMQGQLLSHNADPAVFQCELTAPPSDTSPAKNEASMSNARPVPGSAGVDVRFSSAESRLLTEGEMATLRDALHWDPASASLSRGGTAVSYLVDKENHKLGSIRVQWIKTVAAKGTPSQPAGPAIGSFNLQIENGTSCGFLGQAELVDSKGFVVVSSLDLDSWIGLHQPSAGQTIQVEGDADLPNPNAAIVLKPLEVSAALSACTTPKNP